MKKDPLSRAYERTARTLRAARELAEHAFENPSEETVMRLFGDIAMHLDEIEAIEQPDPEPADEDATEGTVSVVERHTVH